jgi:hypothetical protein
LTVTTITGRDSNQDVSGAKRAAQSGPVIITDRGEPAYVLLRHDAYRRLMGQGPNMGDLLAQRDDADFEFDPPRMGTGLFHVPDLG